nr:retrovirus-related Pol polyprotein from transposon TNT 1-94 [Tanacetum cinerariifolium]
MFLSPGYRIPTRGEFEIHEAVQKLIQKVEKLNIVGKKGSLFVVIVKYGLLIYTSREIHRLGIVLQMYVHKYIQVGVGKREPHNLNMSFVSVYLEDNLRVRSHARTTISLALSKPISRRRESKELVKGSEKATEGNEKAAEGSKKAAESTFKIVANNDDVTIKATPLSSKSPTIVDYKIYKEGRKSFFKIIRVDGYSSVSKDFRIYNTRRQQIKKTYHVTFDESMKAIRFTNTLVDKIGIYDSSRYPPDEFLYEDDPSRQYQVDFDILYYVIPHGRSLTELTQENHIPKIPVQCKGIASNSCKKNTQVPERKSTSGSFQILGGKLVCWSAKKQQSVAMPQLKLNMLLLLGVVQSTAVAFDPFLSTDEPEKCPLMEFLIKFLVSNRRRPLTLNFKTFYSSTDLDYNNGKYVEHPTHEVVKKELGKISITSSYLDKTLVLKNSFPMAWIILFTFVIQVLGGNYSSIEQVNSIHRLLAYSLITSTEVDVEEIIYSDLVTKLLNKSRLKYVSYPRFISCALQVLQGPDYAQDKKFGFLASILSNSNFTKGPSKVTEIELTAYMIDVNNRMDSVSSPPLAAKPKKMKSQTGTTTHPKDSGGNKQPLDRDITFTTPYEGMAKTTLSPKGSHRDKDLEGNKPPADMEPQNPTDANLLGIGAKYQEDQTQSSRLRMRIRKSSPRHTEASNIDSSSDKILKKYDETLPLTERQLVKYLRKVSCVLFERITKDQWEKHEEAVVHYGSPPAGPPPPQNNNGPPLVVRPNGPAPRSMEELCQPSINGWGGPIALIPIQATDFGLRHHMIQQYMKQNGVFDYALRLSLFPYSLTYHATAWYDRLPRNSIHSFDDMMRKFLSKYFPPLMVTKLKNEIMDFRQKPNESLFEAWERYKLSIDWCPNHNMLLVTQIDMFYNEMLNKNFQEMMKMKSVKSVNTKCETCGGPLSYTECPAIDGYTQEAAYATTANLRGDLKAITTRSGVAYDVHTIPPISSPLLKEVESKTKATKEKVQATTEGTFLQKTPEECYDLIKNMTTHHNHWDTSTTRDETSRTITSATTTESPEVIRQLEMLNKNFQEMMKMKSVKSVNT